MKNLLRSITFLLLLNSSELIKAQTPGGIGTGNTMWLRADAGVTLAANTVTQWQDLAAAGVTGNFTVQNIPGTATAQTAPGFSQALGNFNPFVFFNGTTGSLTSVNSFPGTSLVTNSSCTVFQVIYLKGGIVWLKWETDQQGTGARLGFENNANRIRFDFPKAEPAPAGQNVGVTDVLNKFALSSCFADASTSTNRLNGLTDHTITAPTPGNFSPSSKLCLGNDYLLNLPAQIYMSEVIIYSRALTLAEINKVETYLAIKYGFTLNQTTGANNYTGTDGTVIWNNSANSGYANNITGIGRDDIENLLQKQSRTINTSPVVTLYNGNGYSTGVFPASNVNNTNGIPGDKQYLLIGDDGNPTSITGCIFDGKGQRMSRIWKVANSNLSTPVTYTIDASQVPAYVTNIISSPDPTFPRGATTFHPLTAANNKLFADLVLNNNEYFTYATDTVILAPVVTPPTCSNPNSASIVINESGTTAPLTYLWQPTGQTTPDISNVPGQTYTLTISQGSCQANFTFPITPTPAPTNPVVSDVAVCNGNSATLTVQSPNAAYTYTWYNVVTGGTALATGATFNTPAITVSPTTYYVDAASGTCIGPRTAVNVTITPVTAAIVNNEIICSGTAATFTVTNPISGYTYNWYNTSTGGTALATGTTFTTPILPANATYYVETINAGCTIPRAAVNVTVTTVTAPVVNGAAICNGSTATLTVQSPNGAYTYNWYATATGGPILFTGASYTSPALTTTTTYYVDAGNGSCISPRTPVTVTVTTIPVPLSSDVVVCNGSSATLTVQSPNATYTYNWYTVSSGGTAAATGTTFNTPPITVSPTTYYVSATDGTCTSPRTAVNVTITPVIGAVVTNESICGGSAATFTVQNPQTGYTYNWYAAATGGTALATGTTFTTPVLTTTATYYIETINAGCTIPRTPVTATVTTVTTPSANSAAICNGSSATLTVLSPNGAYTYNWYAAATGGTILFTGTSYTTPALTTTTTYYADAVNGSCTSPRTAVTVTVTTIPAPVANSVAVCNGASAALTVQSPNAAYTYNWYTVSTGGTAVATGTTFTTPIITVSPTMYYVDATDGTCTGPRTQVNITITPVIGAFVNDQNICTGTAATFTVQNPQTGYTYNWYSASTGGTALATGITFTTPVLTADQTYYVETINAGCTIPRTPVNVTVTTVTTPAANGAAICTGSSATLTIQGPNAAYTYNWYSSASGGTILFSGTTFTTPALSTTTTYYAEATSNSCVSPRSQPIVVTVTTIPAPVVTPAAVCINTSATLAVQSPNASYTYKWYSSATGGTVLATGTIFTTPAVTIATTYYAEATDGTCNSIRTPVSVTLLPILTAPVVTATSATISSVTFTWNLVNSVAGYQISIDGGTSFILPATTNTYTVTGLQPSQTTNISVIALSGPTGCGDSNPGLGHGTSYSDGFFIPTAFTPNGDSKNDILIPHIPGDAVLVYFTVYNRWGQAIFTTSTIGSGWNGSWQGTQQPNGAYVWTCTYIRGNANATPIFNKGTVMIVR